ncbi:MAG: amidase [Opitutales bacterium]
MALSPSTLPPSFSSWRAWRAGGAASLAAHWRQLRSQARATPGWDSAVAWSPTDEALAAAWAGLPETGALSGIPWMLKDLFGVRGVPTTASSTFLAGEIGVAAEDATIVQAFSGAGGVLVGKTHLNEFAYGLDGVNPHFGTVPNPRLAGRLAGGSSSGSAWAVAAGLVPFAVGTDTGGSIRVPAAFCGLYGFRLGPRHRWSREGCFPLAERFDAAGWFTAHAEDMDTLLGLVPEAAERPLAELPPGLDLTSAGDALVPALRGPIGRVAASCARAATGAEEAFWQRETARLVPTFNILQSRQAYEVHRNWFHARKAAYDPATWARIARAETWTSAQVEEAEATAARWTGICHRLLAEHGFLVLPTAPDLAPRADTGMTTPEREAILAYTVPASIAGCPAMTVPVGHSPETLTGLQIVLPPDPAKAVPLARALLRRFAEGTLD